MSVDAVTLTPLNTNNNNPTPTNYTTSSYIRLSLVEGSDNILVRVLRIASADTILAIDPFVFYNNSSMMNYMSVESSFVSRGHYSSMLGLISK